MAPLAAVENLSFNLDRGEILGFLGPNGAGKTTTMRMLTGFLKPSKGKIFIKNKNIFKNLEYCKKFIGYLPEGSPLYQEMNALDFLRFSGKIRHLNSDTLHNSINKVGGVTKP